jgi:hypothetical protein
MVIATLIGANAMLGPGGPGPSLVKDQPKARSPRPAQTIILERPREEERPQPPVAGTAPSAIQSTPVAPAPPARPSQTPTFTALVGLPTPEEAARATRVAQEKIAAGKAKRRLARERARARAIAAARGPDQQYQDQHAWFGQAYAPRRSYGPFGRSQNSWGNGWSGWDSGSKNQNGKW